METATVQGFLDELEKIAWDPVHSAGAGAVYGYLAADPNRGESSINQAMAYGSAGLLGHTALRNHNVQKAMEEAARKAGPKIEDAADAAKKLGTRFRNIKTSSWRPGTYGAAVGAGLTAVDRGLKEWDARDNERYMADDYKEERRRHRLARHAVGIAAGAAAGGALGHVGGKVFNSAKEGLHRAGEHAAQEVEKRVGSAVEKKVPVALAEGGDRWGKALANRATKIPLFGRMFRKAAKD